jgi:hypothetical protein
MKKLTLFLISLSIASMTSAQTVFDSYMKRVPALPRDTCNITKAGMESFVQQCSILGEELSNYIQEIERKSDDYAEANRGTMEQNAMNKVQQQYGMSEADINKLKNSKSMTDAEKKALANQMVMQQTNMSMEEIQKMSKMSEAGKKAYAEAYGTEAMANAQANPKKYAPDENARNLFNLTNEQQTLNQKITGSMKNTENMYAEIANDPEGKIMRDNMEKWHEKLTMMMGEVTASEEKIMDKLSDQIKNEEIKYCDKFTPKYRAVLKQELATLKSSIPECNRLDQVTQELFKLQTGVDPLPEGMELTSLGLLSAYLGHLQNAYKYKLYYPEDN